MEGLRAQIGRVVDLSRGAMVDNGDWLLSLNYIDFLREIGRHFSVNRMLTMDSVKLRLDRDQPLTFLEFNYMILQSYDFVELYRRHHCILQMGGSDQWGNIVMGADLGRRVESAELFALTSPLLATVNLSTSLFSHGSGLGWVSANVAQVSSTSGLGVVLVSMRANLAQK